MAESLYSNCVAANHPWSRLFTLNPIAGDDRRKLRNPTALFGNGEELRETAPGFEDAVAAAIRARLASIEQEIARLTNLAAKEKDAARQLGYWNLACDLQREANQARRQICSDSDAGAGGGFRSTLRKLLRALRLS